PSAARKIEPAISPETVYALHLPLEHRVENRKLTLAYITAALSKGAVLIEGVTVRQVVVDRASATVVLVNDGRVFKADIIINERGGWSGEIQGLNDSCDTYPVRGQIVCFEARPGQLQSSVFSLEGYLVPRRDGRILAGSTMEEAGFDKSVTLAGLTKITCAALDMTPGFSDLPLREVWSGLRPATRDFLPVLGASPSVPNFIYATGHFRSGILLSGITGEIIADLVEARKPPPDLDLTPFSASRF